MATSADFSINRIDPFSQILGISHIPEVQRDKVNRHALATSVLKACNIDVVGKKRNKKREG